MEALIMKTVSISIENSYKRFTGLSLYIISNAALLSELKNPAVSLLRKKAITNAMGFAKRIREETKGMYPYCYGPNPSGSVPYWFCENKETGLIHVQTDFVKYCYHPGYIFER